MAKNYAVIENGVVVNAVSAEPSFAASKGWVELADGAWIGWSYNGQSFSPPSPSPSTVEVPRSITPRQCRLILYQQGLLGDVEAMIQSSTEDVRITWEYALEFRRDDPLLTQLAANIGLTSQQIDEFFIAASQIS